MKSAVLVRVGVDQTFGGWNAPIDPGSGRFVYVPIPERPNTRFHSQLRRRYVEARPALHRFALEFGRRDAGLPAELQRRSMHLDPDFEHLTYGDRGKVRGGVIKAMRTGDIIAFYSGLRPSAAGSGRLIYAIVGLFVVEEIVDAAEIAASRWHENAHTRKVSRGATDFVVRGRPGVSGRCSHAIPIGEFRNGAYRVSREVLADWGGLGIRDGFIQRSARPPLFADPRRFLRWFERHNVGLVADNFGDAAPTPVILVHLRRPRRAAGESRDDPFWEFGSFGCTGCHARNVMHSNGIREIAGARLGFAQGGPNGIRLVHLTPPIRVAEHRHRCEALWAPASMPFRYDSAPTLVRNDGATDFPSLKRMIRSIDRSSWEARLSSAIRSRRAPVPGLVAREVEIVYERLRECASGKAIATEYWHALPCQPPSADTDRAQTYSRALRIAGAAARAEPCRTRRC